MAGIPRYAAATDENQKEIAEYLRAHGYSVKYIKSPCDLLVGKNGANCLLEVKRQKSKGKKQGKPTEDQSKFAATWRGQYDIVETKEQALEVARRVCEN